MHAPKLDKSWSNYIRRDYLTSIIWNGVQLNLHATLIKKNVKVELWLTVFNKMETWEKKTEMFNIINGIPKRRIFLVSKDERYFKRRWWRSYGKKSMQRTIAQNNCAKCNTDDMLFALKLTYPNCTGHIRDNFEMIFSVISRLSDILHKWINNTAYFTCDFRSKSTKKIFRIFFSLPTAFRIGAMY